MCCLQAVKMLTCATHAKVDIQGIMWPGGLSQHPHHGHKGHLVGLHAAGPPDHLLESSVSSIGQASGGVSATCLDEGCEHYCV